MTTATNSLQGQWALVTGSSSGIGQAIALRLGEAGAHVIVHGNRKPEAARQLVDQLRALGVRSEQICCDLSQPAAADGLLNAAWKIAPIDIWINNAGADVLTGSAVTLGFEEKLAALWAVDVAATIRLARAVGARMQQRGHGVILNMGWDQAERGMEGESGELFAATKGAVMAFTRSLAKSLAPQVRVNCLAPGWIRTLWGQQASAEWQARAVGESLLQRWGTPEDVAEMACYLASPRAAFITGQILHVNGGANR
jgi:3-oxoacyl-[acyl-carrier protein] reductase